MLNKLLKLSEKKDNIQNCDKVKEKMPWGRKYGIWKLQENSVMLQMNKLEQTRKFLQLYAPGCGAETV